MAPTFGTMEAAKYWLNTEPCGLICVGMVYVVMTFGWYAFCYAAIEPVYGPDSWEGSCHKAAYTALMIICGVCHVRTMATDPGSVPQKAVPIGYNPEDKERLKTCMRCDAFKPARTHHCSICKRCIVKMDHHCPWVNNCIGIGNHKFFLLFLLYAFALASYAMVMAVSKFVYCSNHSSSKSLRHRPTRHERVVDPHCDAIDFGTSAMIFAMCIEAVLFGLFTCCMMCDQSNVVFSAVTQIDRLKAMSEGRRSPTGSQSRSFILKNLAEVFGGAPNKINPLSVFLWLLPISPTFYEKEEMLGYTVLSNNESTTGKTESLEQSNNGPAEHEHSNRFKGAKGDAEISQRLK